MVLVTRLRAGRSGVWIPVEARDFSLLQNVPIGSGACPASYSMAIGVLDCGRSYGSFKLWRYEHACEGGADQTVSALPLIVTQRYASHYNNLV